MRINSTTVHVLCRGGLNVISEKISGGVDMRVNIQLECTECKRRNYSTSKNKKTTESRLEMNKYCKWDKKVTLHKETKK